MFCFLLEGFAYVVIVCFLSSFLDVCFLLFVVHFVFGFVNEARKRGMSSCSERLADIEKEAVSWFLEC